MPFFVIFMQKAIACLRDMICLEINLVDWFKRFVIVVKVLLKMAVAPRLTFYANNPVFP
jgi:hypothetical protein